MMNSIYRTTNRYNNFTMSVVSDTSSSTRIRRNSSSIDLHIWDPPKQYGLDNNDKIIPEYYLTGQCKKGSIIKIDFFDTVIDSIKNLRRLTGPQRQYLKHHPDKQYEIIRLYDDVLNKMICDILE